MNLRDKIAVEPLDEMTLARVERTVVSDYQNLGRLPRENRRSIALPAFAAVAAIALAFVSWRYFYTPAQEPGAEVALSEQAIELETAGDATTFAVGRAQVSLAAESQARVVSLADGTTRVELSRGRVDCQVEPYEGRPPFLVTANDVVVEVVGTIFSVENRGGVRVAVQRGKVKVEKAGKTVMLGAGETWGQTTIAATKLGAKPKTEHTPDSDARSEQNSATPDAGPRQPAKLDAGQQVKKPLQKSPPARTPKPKAETTKPAATKSVAVDRPIPGMDPLLDIGEENSRIAAKKYRRLSIGRGAQAAAALYSLAYIELYRMRDARAALASAKRYESRFRRGANAESLLWIRIGALCKQGLQSQCRAAAHSYSRRYPGGRFAGSVADIINQIR